MQNRCIGCDKLPVRGGLGGKGKERKEGALVVVPSLDAATFDQRRGCSDGRAILDSGTTSGDKYVGHKPCIAQAHCS